MVINLEAVPPVRFNIVGLRDESWKGYSKPIFLTFWREARAGVNCKDIFRHSAARLRVHDTLTRRGPLILRRKCMRGREDLSSFPFPSSPSISLPRIFLGPGKVARGYVTMSKHSHPKTVRLLCFPYAPARLKFNLVSKRCGSLEDQIAK